jgi:hypothetical protein
VRLPHLMCVHQGFAVPLQLCVWCQVGLTQLLTYSDPLCRFGDTMLTKAAGGSSSARVVCQGRGLMTMMRRPALTSVTLRPSNFLVSSKAPGLGDVVHHLSTTTLFSCALGACRFACRPLTRLPVASATGRCSSHDGSLSVEECRGVCCES